MTDQANPIEDPIKAREQRISELKKAKSKAQSPDVAIAYKKEIAALKFEITQLQSGA